MAVKPWTQINAYETLCVAPDADATTIRTAYRQASRAAHPDRGGSHDAQVRVNLALEILTDPTSRSHHDRHWRIDHAPPPSTAPSPTVSASAIRDLFAGTNFATVRLSDGRSRTGLERRVVERVDRDRARLEADADARRRALSGEYLAVYRMARFEGGAALGIALVLVVAAVYFPLVWLAVVPLAWRGLVPVAGVRIGGLKVSIADPNGEARLFRVAAQSAQASCMRDTARLTEPMEALDALRTLLTAPTRAPHDASAVRRKAIGTFFLMGYSLSESDPNGLWMRFTRGEESALFVSSVAKSRAGTSTVDPWVSTARAAGDSVLYAYHSAGFTRPAVARAERAGARLFTPIDLDVWSSGVWHSDASGPAGEILALLSRLTHCLRYCG